jgi:hypothetical protein
MDNILNSVHKISKIYSNINYWDEYGTSVIIFILLLIILFVTHSYFYVMINIQPIKDNWSQQRCSPKVIPFAGLINKQHGKNFIEYTEENFTYCVQDILSKIAGYALQPITFLVHTIEGIFSSIGGDIQSIRSMFNYIRDQIKGISQEIMGRLLNIMVPLQEVVIKIRDLFGKVQGTLTAGLYTMLGSYMTLQTLFGAIIQGLITILVIIAGTIAALMIIAAIPIIGAFVLPILAIDIGIFISIAVPTIIICIFASEYLQLQSESLIPSFCFDKNTTFTMKDGSVKTIEKLEVGDILNNGDIITAKLKIISGESKMYQLKDVIVSGSHSVFYNNEWYKVQFHPHASLIENYNEPYLFCLNTNSKRIVINDNTFCDWDELFGDNLNRLSLSVNKNYIHQFTDGGFTEDTLIRLKNGLKKKISDIEIGDILERGENVYGLVEIKGDDLKQYEYHLGNSRYFDGGYNLYFVKNNTNFSTLDLSENNKKERKISDNKLYHLLTDKKTFYVNNIEFLDYNHCIELFFN